MKTTTTRETKTGTAEACVTCIGTTPAGVIWRVYPRSGESAEAFERRAERGRVAFARTCAKQAPTDGLAAVALVGCPFCHAAQGSRCRTADGRTMPRRAHPARVALSHGRAGDE